MKKDLRGKDYTAARYYTDEQWLALEDVCGPLGPDERAELESEAARYSFFRDRIDPSSETIKTEKSCWEDVARALTSLTRALDRLETLASGQSIAGLVLSSWNKLPPTPVTPLSGSGYLVQYREWRRAAAAMHEHAAQEARGVFPKSRGARSNAAISDVRREYLERLLRFIVRLHGKPPTSGKTSPAVRSLAAAARPLIPDITDDKAAHFVRSWLKRKRADDAQRK